jgi:hypothetical protein
MAAAVTMGLALAACSDSQPVTTASPTTTSTSASTSAGSSPLGFSDADNGRTADVLAGQRVTVILHSADFEFGAPTDPAVLRADGPPTVTPGGTACVEGPGSGCGTVVATFVAVALGDAELQADRAACAEPACAPTDAHWRLLVHVVAPGAGSTATTTATTTTTTTAIAALEVPGSSEVRGTVLFSPVCPVERDPPDPACAPRPGPATVQLSRTDGIGFAEEQAGDDGRFSLTVPPGVYSVHAFGAASGVGGGCQPDPAEVTLEPGTSTTVTVSCDTGIR